ncbi:MAG: 3'-5' exonuclease [Bacteroidota bacterium]|nr:3'-5' exonuclease [Bacteroidota bacterium]
MENEFEKQPEFDKDKLIADFMNDFEALDKIDVPLISEFDDYKEFDIELYEPVVSDEGTEDKIKPLQALTKSIEENPLTLSTIHSSKGLEWHVVFIPHLLDGLFPSSRAMKSVGDMEEERRLFYVACTRAKEKLYLSMPAYFNTWDKILTMPSRFMAEIDKTKYKYER